MDHPAGAERDARVIDLRRLRTRAPGAEEEHVAGFDVLEVDPLVFGTSTLMSIVERPSIVSASCVPTAYGASLKIRHTKPEQSKPPGTFFASPGGACVRSEVPAQTYG